MESPNQRVGSHTQTSIQHGTIVAKGDHGKNVAGSCTDGDKPELIEKNGVLLLQPAR